MNVSGNISFGESLIVSGMGILIVFSALFVLAVMILLFSKLFSVVTNKDSKNESDKKNMGM